MKKNKFIIEALKASCEGNLAALKRMWQECKDFLGRDSITFKEVDSIYLKALRG